MDHRSYQKDIFFFNSLLSPFCLLLTVLAVVVIIVVCKRYCKQLLLQIFIILTVMDLHLVKQKLPYLVRKFIFLSTPSINFTYCFTEIRIPLEWREFEHSKVKIGEQDGVMTSYL